MWTELASTKCEQGEQWQAISSGSSLQIELAKNPYRVTVQALSVQHAQQGLSQRAVQESFGLPKILDCPICIYILIHKFHQNLLFGLPELTILAKALAGTTSKEQ